MNARRRDAGLPRRSSAGAKAGFTLIEMLVVIIIIVLLAGTSLMLMNTFFRGQGVRQATVVVKAAVAQAKSLSAEQRRVHFLVFSPPPANPDDPRAEGWVEIHLDSNADGIYNGDHDRSTDDAVDPPIEGKVIELPKGVVFETRPDWVSFQPSGYVMFASGFSEVQAAEFDLNMNRADPSELRCDISVKVNGREFWVLMDLDRAAGKIRRHFFMQKEQK